MQPQAQAPLPPPPLLKSDGAVRPLRQALDLTVVPEAPTLAGSVHLEVQVERATPVLWLNATGLTLQSATVGGKPAQVVEGNEDFVGLVPAVPLEVGPTTVEVRFTAPIDHQRSRGVYAEKEGDETYAYTFFEAIDARRAFPCFDEPGAKIPWSISLRVKKEHLAHANTPITAEVDLGDGMKRVDFAETKPLPSYLVAFVVGPFALVDGGVAGRAQTPIHFIVPQHREAELAWAKEVTPKVVTALEDWFDMPYPFTKLDVAVVPRFWGTMEHPGIVAMGQPLTLIRPTESTRQRKQGYANILAHELAHYWFGDLVTTAWWNDVWLNESLGQWMDLIITDTVMPEWHVRDQGRVGSAERAMRVDELLSTQPIRLPVESRQAIESAFDGDITYLKGSSVMRMFEAFVGPAKWRTFLQHYIHRHEGKNATADDLLTLAAQELGEPVAKGLTSFITQPGVPLLDAKVVCDAAHTGLTVRQQRSLPAGVQASGPSTWVVPVCVRVGQGTKTERVCTMISATETFMALPFCPAWVVLNDDATGYYRSQVDLAQTVALFTKNSPANTAAKLSVAERLMQVADVSAAVSRDQLQLDAVLELVPLLLRDDDDRVVLEGLGLAEVRSDALDDTQFARLLRARQATCAPVAKKLGWVRAAGDSDDRQALRREALRCAAGAKDEPTLEQAKRLTDAWLRSKEQSGLSDDLVSIALHTAFRQAEPKRFAQVERAAKDETNRTARSRLVHSLGAFSDPGLATRARELMVGSEFDLRETSGIVMMQLGRRETREAAWAWVQTQLEGVLARMRSDEASWFLGGLAQTFCDAPHHAQVEALFKAKAPKFSAIDGAQSAIDKGLEESAQCIAEQGRTLPALKRFLAKH